MGTTSCSNITLGKLKKELTDRYVITDDNGNRNFVRTIATAHVGSQFFIVKEVRVASGMLTLQVYRFIEVVIIEGYGKSWSWKEMTEWLIPYYYDCPFLLLAIAGPARYEEAAKWRRACVANQMEPRDAQHFMYHEFLNVPRERQMA